MLLFYTLSFFKASLKLLKHRKLFKELFVALCRLNRSVYCALNYFKV